MRLLFSTLAAGLALFAAAGFAQQSTTEGSYRVLKTAKVGGEGGFDYVYADADGRRLYIARSGPMPRVSVFNLDTLEPAGEIAMTNARGAATDAESHHGFASSKPVAMWDTKTLALIKTIPVDGRPDGILADPFNHHVYVFSHSAPNATVLDAKDGAVLGTIDLGGAPEQAATDGKGHLYVDLEDKDSVAVVDAKAMKVTTTYGLNGKGGGNAGLALDAKNHVLFVACRNPQAMVMLDANDGKVLADLPIGRGCDGATFNPKTMECFSSQGDGTLTVIKEKTPTTFEVEQTVKTMPGAKTLTLDSKTGRVLLIAAEYAAPANPPPPGGRGGRGTMVPGSFSILAVGK
jgi:DNA-binding beta-propeller fold protein YncE